MIRIVLEHYVSGADTTVRAVAKEPTQISFK